MKILPFLELKDLGNNRYLFNALLARAMHAPANKLKRVPR
jgi:hypothetical protein